MAQWIWSSFEVLVYEGAPIFWWNFASSSLMTEPWWPKLKFSPYSSLEHEHHPNYVCTISRRFFSRCFQSLVLRRHWRFTHKSGANSDWAHKMRGLTGTPENGEICSGSYHSGASEVQEDRVTTSCLQMTNTHLFLPCYAQQWYWRCGISVAILSSTKYCRRPLPCFLRFFYLEAIKQLKDSF